MKKILLATFVCMVFNLAAQTGKLKHANSLYAQQVYGAAAHQYERLLGTNVDSPQLKAKLATSYYKIGEYEKSVNYFNQIVTSLDFTPEDTYNYAQALKMSGNYTMSDVWMKKFAQLKSNDSRSIEFLKSPDYLTKIAKMQPHFMLKTLDINTSYSDFGAYMKDSSSIYVISSRPDGRAIKRYYDSEQELFLDIFSIQKDQNGLFSKAKRLPNKVNSKYHEGPLCFSKDLKRVYFTRDNTAKGGSKKDARGFINLKIYYADVNAKGKWENIKEVGINSKDYSVGHPAISVDGKKMFFVSDMPGGFGGSDIYMADIQEDGSLKNVANLGSKINTEGHEMFPWMNGDGNLYFSSNGHLGLGGLDNFVAIMDKQSHEIKKVMNCGPEINSPQDDFALIFAGDQVNGYVSSNRTKGKGKDDIYAFKMIKPFETSLKLKGIITDLDSKEPIANMRIKLTNKVTGDTLVADTDNYGAYEIEIEPEKEYDILVTKKGYIDIKDAESTFNLEPDVEVIEKNMKSEKDPLLSLYALVTEKGTKDPLEGVKIRILDNFTNKDFVKTVTPASGDVRKAITDKKIGERLSYNITIEKDGYLGKTLTFNHQITKSGPINVHQYLDLSLEKLEVGKDLAKMIDLKPIYFDLGKATIRKDAAIELDKIVEVLNNYPDMVIELGSHTDCRSSYAFNMNLSNKRALASAEYIKNRIVNPWRITGKGYGESRLVNGCACEGKVVSHCTEEEHQANRRTEFILVKM